MSPELAFALGTIYGVIVTFIIMWVIGENDDGSSV
jgi:uncharacterized membrane protein YccC